MAWPPDGPDGRSDRPPGGAGRRDRPGAPRGAEGARDQRGYGQPGRGQPRYGEPGYREPRYGEPGYGRGAGSREAGYGERGYGEPGYGEPGYGEPGYGRGAGAREAARRDPYREDAGWPPASDSGGAGSGRSMSGPRRVILMICGALALVVLGLSLSGWLGLRYYDGKVTHVALSFPASSNRPRSAGGGTENILIVGSDSRAGGNAGFGAVAGQRSDTTILAHLDANGTTTLVSFPRDLWVTIPAHRSTGGQQVGDQKSKLNAAFSYGGPSLLVRTIEDLTNIRIDHYLQIDFAGFQRMTDAVDGVDVCVLPSSYREYVAEDGKYSTNTNDPMSGFLGGPGVVHVNGAQGLAFVRQRHGLATGDIARIARQQQFIGAIFRKASSSGVLTNPAKLVSLLDAATSALTLDNGTSLSDLGRLAVRLRSLDSGGVRFATVPATPGERARQSVLLADPTELAAFLSRLTHGAAPTPGPTASGPRSASAPTGVAAVNYHGGRATPVAGMVTGSGGSIQTVQTAAAPATGSCTY